MKLRNQLFVSSALLALAISAPALAQSQASPNPAENGSAAAGNSADGPSMPAASAPQGLPPPIATGEASPDGAGKSRAEATMPPTPKGSTTVGEVIVTAEHRAVDVQKSALNITAITGSNLREKGIVRATDLQTAVPGFTESHQNSNSYIGLYGLQSGGGSMYADASMTFNYGGIPLARQVAAQSSFYDLERVEVLKGPQGTLYGRNATVGALNLVLAQPKFAYSGSATVTYGNYNTIDTTGYINVPLSDKVATRLAWQTTRHDGYYSNGYDDANNYGGRFSVLFKPNEDLSVLLWTDAYLDRSKGPFSTFRYYLSPTQEWIDPSDPWHTLKSPGCGTPILCPTYAQSTVGGVNVQPQPSPAAGGSLANGFTDLSPNGQGNNPVAGDNGFNHVNQYIFAAEINYKVPIGTITLEAAHVNTDFHFLNYTNGLTFASDTAARQDSVELRLASDGNTRLKWVLGGFYFHENQDAFFSNQQNTGYALLDTPNLTDENYAFFGDATFSVTDRIRITGGLRYTHEEKTQDGWDTSTGVSLAQIPIYQSTGSTCYTADVNHKVEYDGYYIPSNFCVIPNAGDDVEKNVSWKVGAEADLAPDSMIYFTVKNGFRAGGFTIGTDNTYKPEHLTAYEFGSKNEFFDRRLLANLSAFYWDYKDEQLSQLQQYYVNGIAAGQTSFPFNVDGNLYGAELVLQGVVTEHDRVNIDVLWTKGKFDQTPLLTNSAGVTAPLTDVPRYDLPEWTFTAGYNHIFDLGGAGTIDAGVRTHYASRTVLRLIDAASEVPGDFQNAYFKWDADVTYTPENSQWSIQGFVENLTDVAVVTPGASGQVAAPTFFKPITNPASVRSATLEPPRTFGVRVTAKF